jgi:hypothetical protein
MTDIALFVIRDMIIVILGAMAALYMYDKWRKR